VSLAALLAPALAPYARDEIHLEARDRGPSVQHLFGTDDLGRDILTRVLHGGRVSLGVAALATLVAVGIGALLGSIGGYLGGRTDGAVSAAVDVALSIPTFFVLLLLASWWGARFGMLCLVIGLTTWMPVARLVRAATLSLRERDFVQAARAAGAGVPRIVLRHVLPNAAAPLIVSAALGAAQAILMESALGFLGFGLDVPTPSWGGMLRQAQAHVFEAPWSAVFPGLLIFGTVLALHLVGDALRDALDPRLWS
jgi:peptide/nickel transport system permease protein